MMTECYFCKEKKIQEKVQADFRWGCNRKVIGEVVDGI